MQPNHALLMTFLAVWLAAAFALGFLRRRAPLESKMKWHRLGLAVTTAFMLAWVCLIASPDEVFFWVAAISAVIIPYIAYKGVRFCPICGKAWARFGLFANPAYRSTCGTKLTQAASRWPLS